VRGCDARLDGEVFDDMFGARQSGSRSLLDAHAERVTPGEAPLVRCPGSGPDNRSVAALRDMSAAASASAMTS
jgi:hypothetical protein